MLPLFSSGMRSWRAVVSLAIGYVPSWCGEYGSENLIHVSLLAYARTGTSSSCSSSGAVSSSIGDAG